LAAEQNNAKAQYSLGSLYARGNGVSKDDAEAVKWIRKSAEQAYAMAQYAMGCAYCNGAGVPKDFVQSYKWFRIAESSGSTEAGQARDALAKSMTKDQTAEAEKRYEDSCGAHCASLAKSMGTPLSDRLFGAKRSLLRTTN
jgi:uncharacterized protein